MTVPALGVGIRPRGPSTLPRRLTWPIMSCVARATSNSSQPSLLDLLDELVAAGEVGAGLLGLGHVVALAEDQHAHRLADAVRQRHAAADHLVALRRVDAQRHVDLDRLVELGPLDLLEQADGPLERARRLPWRSSAAMFLSWLRSFLPRRGGCRAACPSCLVLLAGAAGAGRGRPALAAAAGSCGASGAGRWPRASGLALAPWPSASWLFFGRRASPPSAAASGGVRLALPRRHVGLFLGHDCLSVYV